MVGTKRSDRSAAVLASELISLEDCTPPFYVCASMAVSLRSVFDLALVGACSRATDSMQGSIERKGPAALYAFPRRAALRAHLAKSGAGLERFAAGDARPAKYKIRVIAQQMGRIRISFSSSQCRARYAATDDSRFTMRKAATAIGAGFSEHVC